MSNIRYGALVGATDPTAGSSQGALASAFRMYVASRRADVVFTNEGKSTPAGLIVLAALLSLTRDRKLVLSEFLPGTRTGLRGRAITFAYRALLPRVVLRAQVMTAWEGDDYAKRYRIPRERLHLIPFYSFDDRLKPEPVAWDAIHRDGLLSTGKNSCDWTTVLAAANGQHWPLTIVCRASERTAIARSAAAADVTLRNDIPRAEHDSLLASSALLIVALKERSVSAGHVRLMSAATFGVPVIATAVRGIEGYEQLAVATVPPGDPQALREAVNSLLADPESLKTSMKAVQARAKARPYSVYVAEIARLVRGE